MDLYLLRHAIAEPIGEDNHFQDDKRALTPEGSLKMRRASSGLRRLGLHFGLLASSPLVRARQTAEIVAESTKFTAPIQIWQELAPGGSIDGLFKRLQKYQEKESALLVGHQPDLGYLAARLIFGRCEGSLDFKKGGLCCIKVTEMPPEFPGELVWMVTPRMLRMLADK